MTVTTVSNGGTLLEQAAAWSFLHDLFRPPSDEQWAWLSSAEAMDAWSCLAEQCGIESPIETVLPTDRMAYEEEFICAFEVGLPCPPCPLHESHWNKTRPVGELLHENLLYYKRAGLSLRDFAQRTPDDLLRQLAFMAYLCAREAETRGHPGEPEVTESLARMRSDFLTRHILTWVPAASQALRRKRPESWAVSWVSLLEAYCRPA